MAENPDVTSEEFSLTMKGIPRSRFRKSLKGNKGNSHTVQAVSWTSGPNARHASHTTLAITASTLMNLTLHCESVNHHLGSAEYRFPLQLFGVTLQLKPAVLDQGPYLPLCNSSFFSISMLTIHLKCYCASKKFYSNSWVNVALHHPSDLMKIKAAYLCQLG